VRQAGPAQVHAGGDGVAGGAHAHCRHPEADLHPAAPGLVAVEGALRGNGIGHRRHSSGRPRQAVRRPDPPAGGSSPPAAAGHSGRAALVPPSRLPSQVRRLPSLAAGPSAGGPETAMEVRLHAPDHLLPRTRGDATAMQRRHDIDALRVLALVSLIAYHCGMAYVSEWDWHVKSSYLQEWLQWPMLAMNRGRLALRSLIAGLAIGRYRPARQPGGFAWERTLRLLLPLLFGMFVIVPVQAYCQGVAGGAIEPGYVRFMLRYWQLRPWPAGSFDGAEFGITWNHLWYLAYLWLYSLVLVALLPLLESGPGRRLQAWLGGLRGWRLLLLPALPLIAWVQWLLPRFGTTNALFDDFFQHAQFFTVFLYGYLLARAEGFREELARQRRWLT